MNKINEFIRDITKCLKQNSSPNLEEFSNFAMVYKQVLSMILGVLFGVLGVKGWIGFLVFFLLCNLSLVKYTEDYLGVDEEVVDKSKIYSESLGPSIGLFVLVWSVTHSLI